TLADILLLTFALILPATEKTRSLSIEVGLTKARAKVSFDREGPNFLCMIAVATGQLCLDLIDLAFQFWL
ncbi:hypothetical protein Ciccas_010940, partial [Cichlidogyrus casuarinus]